MSKTWTTLIAFYFLLISAAIGASVLAPGSGDRVAVLTWPGDRSAAEVVARAGGSLLQMGSGNWIAVAVGDSSDFSDRLYRAGALLVMSPSIADACL